MMPRIEPCPFCASADCESHEVGGVAWVVCFGCCTAGPNAASVVEAIERWNTRRLPDATMRPYQQAERAAMYQAIEAIEADEVAP